ncbi:MAG: type II toxin-antitoxin system VapC family toxin [Anaerolineae bacterium]|nr:type II toxin-antitoxin system VapC family toxin [Anaerolineae bacterium]
MQKTNYVYCDANVFLAYFNAEKERIMILDQLFEEIQKDNQRKIVTSVVSITEVSHVAEERNRNQLDKEVYDALESFWGDTSLIEFVDFSEVIARQARDLIRQAISLKYVLRTNDAIHLTSAKYVDVSECFTYDHKLHKFSTIMNYDIREPYINSPKLPLTYFDDPERE